MSPWQDLTWFLGFLLGLAILVHIVLRSYFDVEPARWIAARLRRLLRRYGR